MILPSPHQQLAEDLGEHPRCPDQEVDGRGQRRVQVRVPDQLPARLVEERQQVTAAPRPSGSAFPSMLAYGSGGRLAGDRGNWSDSGMKMVAGIQPAG